MDEAVDPEIQRMEELDQLIAQEEKQWQIAGVSRNMLNTDTYFLDFKVRTLLRIVEERLGITENEMNIMFKEVVLEKLKEDRKMLVKAMQMQHIAIPRPKGIIGPNGTPL